MKKYTNVNKEKEEKKHGGVRPMSMETRRSKVFFSNILLQKNSRKKTRTAAVGKKREKKV